MQKMRDLECDRLTEQARLDGLKTASERNKLGQFATPPALAREIACYARERLNGDKRPIRFLDPAIGTGAFYSATLNAFPKKTIRRAAGVEIDPAFAGAAVDIWGASGLDVTVGDFTRQAAPNERFNLVLTNPPYVRHHHLKAGDKVRLQNIVRKRLGIQISGLAGLYCYFLLLADTWLEAEGLAVWLIPSEFMDVNYGTAVKHYLTNNVTLLHIHRFCPSDVQFDDALVSSAIVVFRKTPPPRDHAVEFSFGGLLRAPAKSQQVQLSHIRGHGKWTAYPGSVEVAKPRNELILSDLFTIRRGLATGDNGFFILPRHKAAELSIPDDCVRPILPSPRYLSEVVVEADCDGFPKIQRQLVLIDCPYPVSEVKHRYPTFWKYLQEGIGNSVDTGYLASRRSPWYSQERREPAPFLSTYMGRSRAAKSHPFRFIWNQSRAVAANVYLMLYPKPELQKMLDADPSLYESVFAALNEIDETSFRSEGRVYGGGLYKMEPAELGRVPAGQLAKIVGLRATKSRQLLAFA